MATTPNPAPNADIAADTAVIVALKARYCRYLDTRDWPAFRGLFVPQARLEFPGEGGTFEGIDRFIGAIGAALSGVVTVHHCHLPEIVITGAGTAEGIFAMEDRLRYPEGHKYLSKHGWGHYHDAFARTADGWRITSVRLTRLAQDLVRRGPA